ncbi:adhesion G-protein coupled receptor G2-like isoform X2 [Corythoichthys intestinalis]|uniref:adhesion G-protein coupled receptor G2-like isoform X2 n=1 Tax=Corythoichthys intestinalis TaxID=161448 RepID=UPI0025A6747F|nr:adhesion G-protein coupled receptor G2-like isoform X2 [Corythoichthys intestinalis]
MMIVCYTMSPAYLFFRKLRRDYPSQILLNLASALLGLNLAFLLNSWLSSWGVEGLCVAAAATLHYFLLASFTWMGLEGVNMYFALVKVFNVYVPSYMCKFCAVGWGIPLVICVLALIVNKEAYGVLQSTDTQSKLESLDNTDNFCWVQDDVTFYVSVVTYAVLVFLFNIAVFVVVLIQIRHMKANNPVGTRGGLMHDLKGVATLTLLLGLTWTIGFFTWGPARVVLLYIFSLVNSLQEWSHSVSVAEPKPCPRNTGAPSVRSLESNSTESTSASPGSSRRGSTYKRPDLGLFVKLLVLPCAQSTYPKDQPKSSTTNETGHRH